MDFDDIFEKKRSHRGNYIGQSYHEDHRQPHDSHYSNRGHDNYLNVFNILEKIRGNKKLKLLVVFTGIVILAVVIILIALLFPLITKLFNYIGLNGLQGVFDSISGFLDQIWKGSGK